MVMHFKLIDDPILNALRNYGYAIDKLWLYCSFIWSYVIYMCKKKINSSLFVNDAFKVTTIHVL